MKIAVITPIPTPYRDAFWNVVAAQPEVELHVLYCATGKADRPWKKSWPMNYHHQFLKGFNLMSWRSKESSLYVNLGVLNYLSQIQPNAVLVGGYNHLTMLLAIVWSILKKVRFYMMCETYEMRKISNFKEFLKNVFLKAIARKSAGGFPTGNAAAEYMRAHGWSNNSLICLPNVPDIKNIQDTVSNLKKSQETLKTKWSVSKDKIVLYVGRLVRKKNVEQLLRAVAGIRSDERPDCVIIGGGDQHSQLINLCRELGIQQTTRFLGFQDPDVILEWFAMANVFVLPSNETWGVAPIEAAAANLNLVLSDEVGSAHEISIRYSKTQIFKFGDIEGMKKAIIKALSLEDNFSNETKKTFKDWGYPQMANNVLRGIKEEANLETVK